MAGQHAEGYTWQPTQAPAEEEPKATAPAQPAVCPRCGEVCEDGAVRCEYCGADFDEYSQGLRARYEQEQLRREQAMKENFPVYRVHGRSISMGDTLAGQPLEEIALQLRGSPRSVTRYLESFEGLGEGRRLGWNWAAFLTGLFGPYWFFFRKLYKPGLLFAGIWLAVALLFTPLAGAFNNNVAPCIIEAQEAIDQNDPAAEGLMEDALQAMQALLREYRWQAVLCIALPLGMSVTAGLVADPLLKKKIWENIAYVHEDITYKGAAVKGGDGPGQRFGRHQLLIRLGGFSFFAPMVYFWGIYFLPDLLVQVVKWITG